MIELKCFEDPEYGTKGWLAYDLAGCRLAVGGCRAQAGLRPQDLITLAERMLLKQRLLGINVGGAKCGIDIDPQSPYKHEVLRRFLAFLRPALTSWFSMGSDMGTRWAELEQLAVAEQIPSIKYAVKLAQGFTDAEFFARRAVLDAPVGALTVAQRRAGHTLSHAALAVAGTGASPARQLTCTLQGFGTLGRAAAYSLVEAGVRVVGVADEHGCAADPAGLDIMEMLGTPYDRPVPDAAPASQRLPQEQLFEIPADIVLLAASQDGMSLDAAASLRARGVIVGANCGLSQAAEGMLTERGIVVVPDYVGGIGGSASMEALFGARHRPTPSGVLDRAASLIRQMIGCIVAHAAGRPLSIAAAELAASARVVPGARPYGGCPYVRVAPEARTMTAQEV